MRRSFIPCLILPTMLLSTSASLFAQTTPATPPAPTINVLQYTEYPSMQPILAIRVHLSANLALRDLVDSALQKNWNCSAATSYSVSATDPSVNSGKPRTVAIANVRLEGGLGGATVCAPGIVQPNAILVLKDHSIASTAKLTVALAGLPTGLVAAPSAAGSIDKSAPANHFALTITPQAAPNEALTSGAKRDVGQLALSFSNPDIAPAFRGFAPYLSTTDLFSTDERDSKSAFAATLGAKRGLTGSWYIPVSLQQTLQGNQVATNLSAVTTANLATIPPWGWNQSTRPVNLYNNWIQAPSPPEFTVSANYTHRINQLVTKATPPLATDDFALNPYATFSPVYLFPGLCTKYHTPKTAAGAAPPPKPTTKQYCLALQTDLGMQYLPLDLTKSGSQRAEGYGDVSILIPLSDIPFLTGTASNIITGTSGATQLQIKWSDAVNAANGYARTRQWTFAFSVIK